MNRKSSADNKNSRFCSRAFFRVVRSIAFAFAALLAFSCSFLHDDDFFSTVETEVAVANAEKMGVYIRYANTRFGKTTPVDASSYTVKNSVPFTVSAITNTEYGFYKWAAFSTADFDPSKQWSNLVFTNDEEYEASFLGKELPESIVKFASPRAENSEVTVFTTRNDIWIIPIVVIRPTISSTFPDTNKYPVVNAKLRIQFSKPMDESSFAGNYTVSHGSLSGDFELNLIDITDDFKIEFNESKKLVTFSFSDPTKEFTPGSNVVISFTEDVRDEYGYNMASSESKRWTIGSNRDSSAPEITALTGGIDGNFTSFESVGKAAGKNATADLANELYTDSVFAQRTNGKVNMFVWAQDIADGSEDRVETDVLMIGFRATSLIDMNGAALDSSDEANQLARSEKTYAAGLNMSDVSGDFLALSGRAAAAGTLYTYDVGSLPDGLIKIDVWAYDMTGNNGLSEYESTGNDSGFKSIFVVKDTHAPDISTERGKVKSSSASAPYGWYRNETIDPIVMYDEAPNLITDVGHEKLRASHDSLWWMFRLGSDTDWTVTRGDAAWKTLAAAYEVGSASIDSDGSVSITVRLMDDLGNMSDVATISSVFYDNTKSAISSLSWVKADESEALNASKTTLVSDSILKIPFTEETSGVKVVRVDVTSASGTAVTKPLAAASITTSAAADAPALSVVNGEADKVAHSLKLADSSAIENNALVLSEAVNTGTLYIKNLTIGAAEESYTVKVTLYDSALNASDSKSIVISHDNTAPVVSEIAVVGSVTRTSKNGAADNSVWIPNSAYTKTDSEITADKAGLSVKVIETLSGIRTITLSGNAHLTASSGLSVGGVEKTVGADFTMDVAENKIVMLNPITPLVQSANASDSFVITNVILDSEENSISVALEDFALNSGSSSLGGINADKTAPTIGTIALSDRGKTASTLDAASGFTNERLVNLTISGTFDARSGISGIVLDSGAKFTDSTKVLLGGSECSFTKKSATEIEFMTVYVASQAQEFVVQNVELEASSDGSCEVSAHVADKCGWTSPTKSSSIILDTMPPRWDNTKPVFVGSGNTNIYPTEGKMGVYIGAENYFYTKEGSVKLSVTYDDANFLGAVYSSAETEANAILSGGDSLDTNTNIPFTTNGDSVYSIVLKDKAGNISEVKTFHVIKDTEITTKTGASNNSLTTVMEKADSRDGYKVYLEKKAQGDGSFRNRFSTSGGQTAYIAVDLSGYSERVYGISQSGLAFFAINASESVAPSETGSAKDFNKWIPYDSASSEANAIVVWIPASETQVGPYYLWLKDNVGNTSSVQIRTPAHETSNTSETWLGKAGIAAPSLVDYVDGTGSSATSAKDGTLVTSAADSSKGTVTYFTHNARFGLSGDGGILFADSADENDYPVRFALVKQNGTTALDKASVVSLSESGGISWMYPNSYASSGSEEYSFTARDYPSDSDYVYLHYVIEDATGNIATAVFAPTAVSSKWKYDDDAPLVTLRENAAEAPDSIASASIANLIPAHYGRQAAPDASDVIWVSGPGTIADSTAEFGANTVLKTAKSLYFDIAVSESTRITQFCYTDSASVALDSVDSDGNSVWKTTSNGKIDTSIPTGLLSSAGAIPLYLHVRDIVGNFKTYRLSTGTYKLDTSAPVIVESPSPAFKLEENAYYLAPGESGGEKVLNVAFSAESNEQDEAVVAIPMGWFTDEHDSVSGSGVFAYSLEAGSVPNSQPVGGPSITLKNGVHYKQGASEIKFNLYVYDAVGNYFTIPVVTRVDENPPTFNLEFKIYTGGGASGNTGLIFDAVKKTVTSGTTDTLIVPTTFQSGFGTADTAGYSEENPYRILSSASLAYIEGTFKASDNEGGISTVKVKRKRADDTDYTDITDGLSLTNASSDPTSYEATVPIDLDAGGRLYEITVADYAGNATVTYMHLFLDRTAPAFTENPTVTAAKGSVNTDGMNYYYNEMNITFKTADNISDANTTIASGSKSFVLNGGISGSEELKSGTLADDSQVKLTAADFAAHASGLLSVTVTDNLGNARTSNLYLAGTEIDKNWVRDTTAPAWDSSAAIGELSGSNKNYFTISENYLLYSSRYGTKSVSVKPTAASDENGIMGYVLSDSELAGPYSSADFPSSVTSEAVTAGTPAFVKAGGSFIITPSTFIDLSSDDKTAELCLYAVDYAGNMTKQEFYVYEDAGYPSVTGITAASSENIYCSDSQNYYNTGAKIKVTASVSATRGSGSVSIKWYLLQNTDEIGDDAWQDYPSDGILPLPASWNAGDTLYLILISNRYGATIEPVKLTGTGSLASAVPQWTLDTTPPNIELSYKSGDVSLLSPFRLFDSRNNDSFETGETYITNGDGYTAAVSLADTESGVASSSVGSSTKTGTSYEVSASSDGNTVITATDNVGNSTTFTITTQVDATAPDVGNLVVVNTDTTHSVNKKESGGTTIFYYNAEFAKLSASVGDTHGDLGYTYLVSTESSASRTRETDWPSVAASSGTISGIALGTDGELYLHVSDALFNVKSIPLAGNAKYTPSSSVATEAQLVPDVAVWKNDGTAPYTPSDVVSLVADGNGVYFDKTTDTDRILYYSTVENVLAGTVELIPQSSVTDTDIMGFRTSATGTSYAASITPTLTNNGQIEIYAVDYAGNISETPYKFKLVEESSKPTMELTLASGTVYENETGHTRGLITADGDAPSYDKSLASGVTYWTNAAYTVSLSIKDAISGLDNACLSGEIDGSPVSSGILSGAGASWTVKPAIDAGSEILLTAKTKAGTPAEFTLATGIDKLGPDLSNLVLQNKDHATGNASANSINADASNIYYYNPAQVVISVTASDDRGVEYALMMSETAPSGWSLTIPSMPETASGASLFLYAKDALGNLSHIKFAGNSDNSLDAKVTSVSGGTATTVASTATWTADSSEPVGVAVAADDTSAAVFVGDDGKVYFSDTPVSFTLSATEANTVFRYYYTLGSEDEAFTTDSSVSLSPAASTTLTVYALDYAGNKSSATTVSLVSDTVDPVITAVYESGIVYKDARITSGTLKGSGYYTNADGYSVTLKLPDIPSGVKEWTMSGNGTGDELTPSSDKKTALLKLKSSNTVTVSVTTNVGRTVSSDSSDAFSIDTIVDNTEPVVSAVTLANGGSNSVNTDDTNLYYNNDKTSVSDITVTESGSGNAGFYKIIQMESDSAPTDTDVETAVTSLKLGSIPEGISASRLWLAAIDNVGNIGYTKFSDLVLNYTAYSGEKTANAGTIAGIFSLDSATAPKEVSIAPGDSAANGNGAFLTDVNPSAKTGKLYYNKSLLSEAGSIGATTLRLALTPADGTSLMGYQIGTESIIYRNTDAEFLLPLDLASPASSVSIYAVDYAGNVSSSSSSAFTLSLVEETEDSVTVGVKLKTGKLIATGGTALVPEDNADSSTLGSGVTYYTNESSYTVSLSASADGTSSGVKSVTKTIGAESSPLALTDGECEIGITAPSSDEAEANTVTLSVITNVGTAADFVLKTKLDTTGPVVTGITLAQITTSPATKVVKKADSSGETILYYNSSNTYISAVTVTENFKQASPKYALVRSQSESGFTAETPGASLLIGANETATASGALYIVAEDLLGNTSYTPFTDFSVRYDAASESVTSPKWQSLDSVAAPSGVELSSGLEGSGAHFEDGTVFYNLTKIGSNDFSVTPTHTDSELVEGFSTANDGTAAATPFAVSKSPVPSRMSFYAVDIVGNVSDAYELSFREDTSAPTITAALSSGTVTADKASLIAPPASLYSADDTAHSSPTYYTASGYTASLEIADNENGSGIASVTGADYSSGYSVSPAESGEIVVTATDNVGNEASFTLKTEKISAIPSADKLTLTLTASVGSVNMNATTNELYFNTATASLTSSDVMPVSKYDLSLSDTGVTPSVPAATNTSLADFAGKSSGSIYVWVSDILGNTGKMPLSEITTKFTKLDGTEGSASAAYTLVQDTSAPAAPARIAFAELANGNTVYFNSEAKELYYKSDLTAVKVSPRLSDSDSVLDETADPSFMGYLLAQDSADCKTEHEITLSDGGTVNIYTVDYAGNVSPTESPLSITLHEDGVTPASTLNDSDASITNLSLGAYKSGDETVYIAFYAENFAVPLSISQTPVSGIKGYYLSTAETEPTIDSEWKAFDSDSGNVVPLPATEDSYTPYNLWLCSNIGTISERIPLAVSIDGNEASNWRQYTDIASSDLKYYIEVVDSRSVLYISGFADSYPISAISGTYDDGTGTPAALGDSHIESVLAYTTREVSSEYTPAGTMSFNPALCVSDTGVIKISFNSEVALKSLTVSDAHGVSKEITIDGASMLGEIPVSSSISSTGLFSAFVSRASNAIVSVFRSRSVSHEQLMAERESQEKPAASANEVSSPTGELAPHSEKSETWAGLSEQFAINSDSLDAAMQKLNSVRRENSSSAVSVNSQLAEKHAAGVYIPPRDAAISDSARSPMPENEANGSIPWKLIVLALCGLLLTGFVCFRIKKSKKNL